MSEPKLRPCPFCGASTASFVCHDPDAGFPHLDVVCNDCGARVETPAEWGDHKLAAGIWNTRPDDAERERLRSLVGRLAQRIQFARLADPNPGGEDPLLREAAAVCKKAREEK